MAEWLPWFVSAWMTTRALSFYTSTVQTPGPRSLKEASGAAIVAWRHPLIVHALSNQ